MMTQVVVQDGIDASKLKQAIYQAIVAGAVAEAESRAKLHGDRAALADKFGVKLEAPGPVQPSLFGGDL